MYHRYLYGLGLVFTLAGSGDLLPVRADETATSSAPRELQNQELPRWKLTPISPPVRQTGFASVGSWQDPVTDQCDERGNYECPPRRRLCEHCCCCRNKKYECYAFKDWFCYIRGYGPTVWDRHGQIWHPRDPYYVRYNNYMRYSHPEPWLETQENCPDLARKEGFAK